VVGGHQQQLQCLPLGLARWVGLVSGRGVISSHVLTLWGLSQSGPSSL
jgi:hypothetical protein